MNSSSDETSPGMLIPPPEGFLSRCGRKRVIFDWQRVERDSRRGTADKGSSRRGTDPACLDPREWLAALSLGGGPWGAEGCCQLGWTAQDLPPHGDPRPPTPPCTFATGSQTYLRRNSGFFILLSFPNNLMPTMGKIIPLGARSATQGRKDRERERAGYYHVDEYLREISASRSTRLRLRRLGPGILDVTDCGELFAAVGRTGLLRVSCLGECKTQGLQGLCKIN